MNKEIKYSGVAASLPGYNCPDGEFDVALNLWPENGAYKPVLPPSEILTLASGKKVIFIHRLSTSVLHYIIYDSSSYKVYWSNDGTTPSANELITLTGQADIPSTEAMGNTLMIFSSTGVNYFLWNPGAQGGAKYETLGNHFPELDLSFGLQGEMLRDDSFSVTLPDGNYIMSDLEELSENNSRAVTEAVLAKVNLFIANHTKKDGKGRFIFPFMLRYVYRLYDGSFTMQSAPVFMPCATDVTPAVDVTAQAGTSQISCTVFGMVYDLDMAALSSSQLTLLSKWKDVIRSVDVFISSPFWTYDQSGKITSILGTDFETSKCVAKWTNPPAAKAALIRYQQYEFKKLREWMWSSARSVTSRGAVLPGKESDWLEQQVAKCGNYYLLKSFNIDDLTTTRGIVEIDDEYLQSLVNREALADDYDSHDTLIANSHFVYNQRLNLGGVNKDIFLGYHPQSAFCHSDGYRSWQGTSVDTTYDRLWGYKFFFYILDGSKTLVVSNSTELVSGHIGEAQMGWRAAETLLNIYYPSTKVQKVLIKETSLISPLYYEIPMKEHPSLNGSIYAKRNYEPTEYTQGPDPSISRRIELPNKLYTSEVSNPYYFPVTNINTIGTGEIIGISAAAKPLSLGQFGEFPLYAFCSDGIWALTVSSTGGFSAKQPISMEVCKPGTISQLDSSVAFASGRGIMIISGSTVMCISETIDGKSDGIFKVDNTHLPSCQTLLSSADVARLASVKAFRSFLPSARTIYDCVSQRLIIYNPSESYAYIFAMDGSKQWGMMRSNISSVVNSYPNAMAMTTDGKLVDFSVRGTNTITSDNYQIALTRPLKLDFPDVLKRVSSVIQRGTFSKHTGTYPNSVQGVLYGSRDLANWFPVWSSTDQYIRGFNGTPYKYYRLLLRCYLRDEESLSGCSFEFTPELTDIPR